MIEKVKKKLLSYSFGSSKVRAVQEYYADMNLETYRYFFVKVYK